MSWKNITVSNGNEVSSLFASFFENIYKTPSENIDLGADSGEILKSNQIPDVHIVEIEVRFDDVYRQLLSVKVNKGAGPDGIPNIFLQKCAMSL